MNPYASRPLTAVIRNGGYVIEDATVRVVPKKGGQEIAYKVNNAELKTHAGIPVFGLYADYENTVEVSYNRLYNGKKEAVKETYKIRTAPVYMEMNGSVNTKGVMFDTEVKHVDAKYADRLYLVNNLVPKPPRPLAPFGTTPRAARSNGRSVPKRDRRHDGYRALVPHARRRNVRSEQPYKSGIMMGFQQAADGNLVFGYGQRYAKYDMLGREIFNRRLPMATPTIRTHSTRRKTVTPSCVSPPRTCAVPTASVSIRSAT